MSLDREFLGADAVTAEDGIGEEDHAQTRIKVLIARCVYVLADSSSSASGISTPGRGWRCRGHW
ncbi:hypothetical protein QK290_15000 [Pseudarthrobacter sp. AL07]|uniref:hypothetical protein n=1 Tax=unclassified Pseudarthrobacter TaxID=2647000 RepID=UPI00249CADD9|nr:MULTISPECIES: hypothetical protein [unclassified Pseudarthrobacter]MDI3195675.1 hypothetical protein [Pseudarthrobacter sp. AL20]MDI3209776.1 hypothetical protein [Pseudarthrobacter sp. AL07]